MLQYTFSAPAVTFQQPAENQAATPPPVTSGFWWGMAGIVVTVIGALVVMETVAARKGRR